MSTLHVKIKQGSSMPPRPQLGVKPPSAAPLAVSKTQSSSVRSEPNLKPLTKDQAKKLFAPML